MIFGIGLPRTGTNSLTAALNDLGYSAVQEWLDVGGWRNVYANSVPALDRHCGAVIGFCSFCYPLLDRRYPSSKFILTLRYELAWLESVRRLCEQRPEAFGREFRERIFGFADYDARRLRQAWLGHYVEVQRYFAGREGDLLIMDIAAGDGWDRLCPFLGVKAPDGPFPHRSPSSRWSVSKRRVAQPGSAPGLGPGGRRFESGHADQWGPVVQRQNTGPWPR